VGGKWRSIWKLYHIHKKYDVRVRINSCIDSLAFLLVNEKSCISISFRKHFERFFVITFIFLIILLILIYFSISVRMRGKGCSVIHALYRLHLLFWYPIISWIIFGIFTTLVCSLEWHKVVVRYLQVAVLMAIRHRDVEVTWRLSDGKKCKIV